MKRIIYIFLLITLSFMMLISIKTTWKYRKMQRLINKDTSFTQLRKMSFTEKGLENLLKLEKNNSISAGTLVKLQYLNGNGIVKESGLSDLERTAVILQNNIFEEEEQFAGIFNEIWNGLRCFPTGCRCTYEDTWMCPRTFGGTRGHEGCDLFPQKNIDGFYQIYSVTDGQIEQKGWLPMGGYRLGIRSSSGTYFYYAHLASFAENLTLGDTVKAGQFIGLMGSSGYSRTEGTSGRFPVHLHFGIYVRTEQYPELSINPYWILRYLDAKR